MYTSCFYGYSTALFIAQSVFMGFILKYCLDSLPILIALQLNARDRLNNT